MIDLWWQSLIDHIKLSLGSLPSSEDKESRLRRHSSLLAALKGTLPDLELHLSETRRLGLEELDALLNKPAGTTAATSTGEIELRASLDEWAARLRAAELELQDARSERDERESRIHTLEEKLASTQRKIDRQKSITLARIEASARRSTVAGSTPPAQVDGAGSSDAAGQAPSKEQQEALADLQESNRDLTTRLAEQQDRLTELESSKQSLTDALANLDAETIRTAPSYVALKAVNEHLRGLSEAQETALLAQTDELETLRAEREAFKADTVAEQVKRDEELLQRITQAEQDLARVRSNRDELHAQLMQRKSQDEAKSEVTRELGELADNLAVRIEALEAENGRLKAIGDGQSADDENQKLKNELAVMERAFKQAIEQSSRKVMDLASMEERVGRLQAEKAKADQKYFAAMKAKDQILGELRAAKIQSQKSAEALQRLSEAEEGSRLKIQALDRRAAAGEKLLAATYLEVHRLQESLTAAKLALEQKTTLVDELQGRSKVHVGEVERLKQSDQQLIEDKKRLQRELDRLKTTEQDRATNNGESEQLQAYRSMALCSVCNLRWKDTAITSCGHVFCRDCVDKRVETRQRRCPSCNKAFGAGDLLGVHL